MGGHDRGGKTTIAKALAQRLNIPYFKAKRDKYWWDPSVNLNYYTEGITQFLEQSKSSAVLDRWHPCDFMYSKLFNRDISYPKIAEIDQRMSEMNALIVICYKRESAYITDEEDADFVNPKMYTKMTSLYRKYVNQYTVCNCMMLDTTNENLDKQINKIISRL